MTQSANPALHRKAIPVRSIAAGELRDYLKSSVSAKIGPGE